jgi:sugar lactone lactonase YvrE
MGDQLGTLSDGIAFGESARWHDGRLWFCDWGAKEVVAVELAGRREVIARVDAFPFCIDWMPDGRLLIAAGQRVLRREPDGSLVTHAELGRLSPFAWNEIVVDARGNAYVNNVGFDFARGAFAPGIVALVTPDGEARQVADGVAFPNGMVLAPDGATLIVAESYGKKLTAFAIAGDGGLGSRRVWAALGDGVPDGICVDGEGAVWYADVPHRSCVRVREGGEVLQTIDAEHGCFSCALGGRDGRTLFLMTAEWRGPERIAEMIAARTGRVRTVEVEACARSW